MADHIVKLDALLKLTLGDYVQEGIGLKTAGKSAVLRVETVNCLDFQKDFFEQLQIVVEHLEMIRKMTNLTKRIDNVQLEKLYEEIV